MVSVEILAEVSRRYGSDPQYVLAGGGNTSFKDDKTLYIKASGYPLSTIDATGFVRMDRAKLGAIWLAEYPEKSALRETRALEDLMASRLPGEEEKRPSVETLLHDALEEAYVVHTHPALVNGLTCSLGGKARAAELFGDDVLWIPMVEPGYILAKTVRRMRSGYIATFGREPKAILLQNHGIFVSAETVEVIDEVYREVFAVLNRETRDAPDLTEVAIPEDSLDAVESAIRDGISFEVFVASTANPALLDGFANEEAFAPFSSAYTPDHIVYSGHRPVYVDIDAGRAGDTAALTTAVTAAIAEFRNLEAVEPKLVAVPGVGAFGIGDSQKTADRAVTLYLDTVRTGTYSASHGGHRFLTDEMISFIRTWEVESYRSTVGNT